MFILYINNNALNLFLDQFEIFTFGQKNIIILDTFHLSNFVVRSLSDPRHQIVKQFLHFSALSQHNRVLNVWGCLLELIVSNMQLNFTREAHALVVKNDYHLSLNIELKICYRPIDRFPSYTTLRMLPRS